MTFGEALKALMEERNVNQSQLADKTGMAVSSISQYLSGKTGVPREKALQKIAWALDTTVDYLLGDTPDQDVTPTGEPCKKITVKDAAKLLGTSEQFIRVSLQRKAAPFGFAVQMPGGKWSYHISPRRFYEYVGGNIS